MPLILPFLSILTATAPSLGLILFQMKHYNGSQQLKQTGTTKIHMYGSPKIVLRSSSHSNLSPEYQLSYISKVTAGLKKTSVFGHYLWEGKSDNLNCRVWLFVHSASSSSLHIPPPHKSCAQPLTSKWDKHTVLGSPLYFQTYSYVSCILI